MKLHLPKTLLVAVLAACVAPSWAGITKTSQYEVVTIDASSDYSGSSISYANGVVQMADEFKGLILTDVTFDLNYNQINTATPLMYVGTADFDASIKTNVAFGFYTTTGGGITGAWDQNNKIMEAWTNRGTVANAVFSGKDTDGDGVITLTASFGKTSGGTHLAVGDTITPSTVNIAASDITADSTGNIYGATDLRGSDADDSKLTINTSYISKLYLRDYTTTFAIENHSVSKNAGTYLDATTTRLQLDGGDSGSAKIANDSGNPIYVGGGGQLFLQTFEKGSISLKNDIYLSDGTYDGHGDLRFGNDGSTYTTTLTGTIYVLENSEMKTTGSNAISIEGTVTDKFYIDGTASEGGKALTIRGSGYDFSGAIDLSTLTLAGSVQISSKDAKVGNLSVGAEAALTVADEAKLTISDTLSLQRAITINGTLTAQRISISSLDGFEGEGSYTEGNTAGNGYFGGDYQIINGSNKAGYSVVYGDTTYTTSDNGSINTTDYSTFHINTGTEAISTAKGNAATNTIEMANGTTLTVDADFATVRTADGATAVALTVNNATDTNPTITTLSAAGAEVTVGGTSGLSITNATASKLTANADINLGSNKHEVGALVINDGATVLTQYKHSDTKNEYGFVKTSIQINAGGTLKHTGDSNAKSPFGQGNLRLGSITMTGTAATADTAAKTAQLLLTNRTVIEGTSLTLNGNTLIGSAGSTGAVTDASEDSSNTQYRDNRAILDFVGANTVAVSGTNNTIDAALRLRDGKTTFEVNNTTKDGVTTEGSVVINGNIFKSANGTFAKSGDGKLTIASTTAGVHNAEVTGGTLEIAGGKTLAATGTMTVGAAGTLALSSQNAFSVTGALTFEEGAKLSYTLSTMPAAESGDISYTLGTAGSIFGVDTLTYTGDVKEGYTAKLSTVAGTGSTQNLVLTFEQNAITLTETQVTEVLGFADGVLTLKTDVSANKYVFGDTFNVNITDDLWETVIAKVAPDYANAFSITMQDASGTVLNFGTATPTVVFNGQGGQVLPTTAGTAGTYAIPEPTTATLSLLALAALAARRRRK